MLPFIKKTLYKVDYQMTHQRTTSPSNETPFTSSMTATVTVTGNPQIRPENRNILHLRSPGNSPRVHWAPDTLDNENLGRKKSNVCCIFHPRDNTDAECSHHNTPECPHHKPPSPSPDNDDMDSKSATGDSGGNWNAYEHQPRYH